MIDPDILHPLEALEQLAAQIERFCPCGARPESLNTHPHVIGCPVAELFRHLALLRQQPDLRAWVQHKKECWITGVYRDLGRAFWRPGDETACTCGLDAALLRQPETPNWKLLLTNLIEHMCEEECADHGCRYRREAIAALGQPETLAPDPRTALVEKLRGYAAAWRAGAGELTPADLERWADELAALPR